VRVAVERTRRGREDQRVVLGSELGGPPPEERDVLGIDTPGAVEPIGPKMRPRDPFSAGARPPPGRYLPYADPTQDSGTPKYRRCRLVGLYINPRHVDGEVRTQFLLCFRARILGGDLSASSETKEVRFVPLDEPNM
jgi:hypothetical protein